MKKFAGPVPTTSSLRCIIKIFDVEPNGEKAATETMRYAKVCKHTLLGNAHTFTVDYHPDDTLRTCKFENQHGKRINIFCTNAHERFDGKTIWESYSHHRINNLPAGEHTFTGENIITVHGDPIVCTVTVATYNRTPYIARVAIAFSDDMLQQMIDEMVA